MANQCTVVVPIYKGAPSPQELASLTQVISVLQGYEIVLAAPESLEASTYRAIATESRITRFTDAYFADTGGYNRLMLSPDFYWRFESRPYILIYQLDAWVFRDELAEWCARGYSYVGAPWVGVPYLDWAWHTSKSTALLMAARGRWRNIVGNGGFSLRHVHNSLHALEKHSEVLDGWTLNEDWFWSIHVQTRSIGFRVPGWKEAAHFSFELQPGILSAKTGVSVPFGCHGWQRHEPEYWRGLIPAAGD